MTDDDQATRTTQEEPEMEGWGWIETIVAYGMVAALLAITFAYAGGHL